MASQNEASLEMSSQNEVCFKITSSMMRCASKLQVLKRRLSGNDNMLIMDSQEVTSSRNDNIQKKTSSRNDVSLK